MPFVHALPFVRSRARHAGRFAFLLGFMLVVSLLGGCAGMFGRDPVRVTVAGIEPAQSEGMEMRFSLKLRVQNPNDAPIDYDGLSLDLALNGKPFASGVSDARGTVPRFGEAVVSIPVTVSAFSAVRQAFAFAGQVQAQAGEFPYELHGRLGGGPFGGARFTDRGTLALPAAGMGAW